jgi:hypothetical protein
MVAAFRSHVRQNVVGYIAIFLVLGGSSAYALAGHNTVFSDDIVNHQVKTRDLAKNVGLVSGNGKLLSRSFSASQVGFLPDPKPALARIRGFGKVEFLYCGTAPNRQMRVRLLSGENAPSFFFTAEVRAGGVPAGTGQQHNFDTDGGSLSSGGGTPLITPTFTPNGFTLGQEAKWDFQVWRGTGANTTGAHVSVSGINGFDDQCHLNAQTIIQK